MLKVYISIKDEHVKNNQDVRSLLAKSNIFPEDLPSEDAINEIVDLLDLSSCQVTRKNYGELMMDKFRELQLPLSNIQATFVKQKELLSKLE